MFINIYVHMLTCGYMGRMQIVLADDVEKRLREQAAAKFGFKKGSISLAIEEAIKEWLRKNGL